MFSNNTNNQGKTNIFAGSGQNTGTGTGAPGGLFNTGNTGGTGTNNPPASIFANSKPQENKGAPQSNTLFGGNQPKTANIFAGNTGQNAGQASSPIGNAANTGPASTGSNSMFAQPNKPAGMFGNQTQNTGQPATTGGSIGAPSNQTGGANLLGGGGTSLFNQGNATTSTGGQLGNQANIAKPPSTSPLVTQPTTGSGQLATVGNLFGQPPTGLTGQTGTATQPVAGTPNTAVTTAPTGSLFGGNTNAPNSGTNLFGGNKPATTTTTSPQNVPNQPQPASGGQGSGSIFANKAPTAATGGSMFNNPSSSPNTTGTTATNAPQASQHTQPTGGNLFANTSQNNQPGAGQSGGANIFSNPSGGQGGQPNVPVSAPTGATGGTGGTSGTGVLQQPVDNI